MTLPSVPVPAAMPSEEEIAKMISGAPFPSAKSLMKARAILDLFAPILAEKEREIERLRDIRDRRGARIIDLSEQLALTVSALMPFADEKNGVMQDLLWGDQPDSATMTITCPLGQVRKARAAIRAAAIRAQGE